MHPFTVQHLPTFVPAPQRPYERAVVVGSVFSARQCDRIIASVADTDDARVGTAGDDVAQQEAIRRSRIAWIPADEANAWIHDKLAAVVRRANRFYGFDLVGFTEDLQFTEYDGAGAFYDWHQDGLDGELAVRKLSLVVQLSDPDDYAGGELELFGIDDADEASIEVRRRMRRQGTVIAFPSFEFHRVTPVLSGTRRSLVCWVGGPPFR